MNSGNNLSRRRFMQQAAAVSAAATIAPRAFADGKESIRVGIVGCGGRGMGSAVNALRADPGVQIVAMGDAFEDRLEAAVRHLQHATIPDAGVDHNLELARRLNVPPEHRFVGFDAYKKVIDLVDVVILTTPPYFRPMQLTYAVEQGKHVFAEKPVATDAHGVRQCLAAAKVAKEKNLSLVSGLCWRYHIPRVTTMQRVLDGGIGDTVSIETIYNVGGVWDARRRRDQVDSDIELQMRNWYYYTWLSGDHIVEQAVHALDTMAWAMKDQPPMQCWGSGGRQVRTSERHGNIYDHFSIVFEYANGVHGYHHCRQWPGVPFNRIEDNIFGNKGMCDVWNHRISGENTWKYDGPDKNMYQNEHDELFKSIREGKPINDGVRMSTSTMLAIMGRMAAYTGSAVTWDMAMNSQERLGPEKLEWGDAPPVTIAMPGQTKFS